MPYIHIDLSEFETDELVEELEIRGVETPLSIEIEEKIRTIYFKRRSGMDYQSDLDELIYNTIGKIV